MRPDGRRASWNSCPSALLRGERLVSLAKQDLVASQGLQSMMEIRTNGYLGRGCGQEVVKTLRGSRAWSVGRYRGGLFRFSDSPMV